MSFADIEPAITAWAAKRKLEVFSSYRDVDVRSVEVVARDGRKCHLIIAAADRNGNLNLHVHDRQQRRVDYRAHTADLGRFLDQAYAVAAKRRA